MKTMKRVQSKRKASNTIVVAAPRPRLRSPIGGGVHKSKKTYNRKRKGS